MVAEAYDQLAGAPIAVGLGYEPPWRRTGLAAALAAARSDDVRRGVSTVGPHRDELVLTLDGLPVRTHASQGEQRTFALALRLAAHRLVAERTGSTPVLVLDDVLSELDPAACPGARSSTLPPGQVVITTANAAPGGGPARSRATHRGRSRDPVTDRDPIPISASLDEVVRSLRGPGRREVGGVFGRWEEAVGAQVAAHARPVRLDGGVLVVEVDEPAWATQITLLSNTIRERLMTVTGVEVDRRRSPGLPAALKAGSEAPSAPLPTGSSVLNDGPVVERRRGVGAVQSASSGRGSVTRSWSSRPCRAVGDPAGERRTGEDADRDRDHEHRDAPDPAPLLRLAALLGGLEGGGGGLAGRRLGGHDPVRRVGGRIRAQGWQRHRRSPRATSAVGDRREARVPAGGVGSVGTPSVAPSVAVVW